MRRLHCGKADWHVFARGARRLDLFHEREDFLNFVSVLQYALAFSGCTLWAFTLMNNHYHLVVRATSDELTACMRRLNAMYSAYHNRKYGFEGHAFDGPYKAYRQGSLTLLLRCIAYVFLNPVTAGLAKRPEDYPWSSYRDFTGHPNGLLHLNTSGLLAQVAPSLKATWALFHRMMDREAVRLKDRPVHGLSMVEVHRQQFEWLLEHAVENSCMLGANSRDVAIYWARQCGISPRAIASALGDLSAKQVGVRTRNLRNRIQRDPDLAKGLALP